MQPNENLSPFLHSLLLNLCVGIGAFIPSPDSSKPKFQAGPEALECLKDLKKVLRQDYYSTSRLCFQQLGQWNIIERHLIPFFLQIEEPENVDQRRRFEQSLQLFIEVCVPLTWPVDKGSVESVIFKPILLKYKFAFANVKVWQRLCYLLASYLKETESELKKNLCQLVLCLVRNIGSIGDPTDTEACRADDSFVNALATSRMLDLLVVLGGQCAERMDMNSWSTILLGIFHSIFRIKSSDKNVSLLNELIGKEQQASTRHSKFGGEFALNVKNGQFIVNERNKKKDSGPTQRVWRSEKTRITTVDVKTRSIIENVMKDFDQKGMGLLSAMLKALERQSTFVSDEDAQKFADVVYWLSPYKNIFFFNHPMLIKNIMDGIVRSFEEKNWSLCCSFVTCLGSVLSLSNESNILSALLDYNEGSKIVQQLLRNHLSVDFLKATIETNWIFYKVLRKYVATRKDEDIYVNVESFELEYSHEDSLFQLLRALLLDDENTVNQAVKFLHRVAVKHQVTIPFFRLSTMSLVHTIYHKARFSEAKRFANFLINAFMTKLRSFPFLLVEMLYRKGSSDIAFIEQERDPLELIKKVDLDIHVAPECDKDHAFNIVITVLVERNKSKTLRWIHQSLQEGKSEIRPSNYEQKKWLENKLVYLFLSLCDLNPPTDTPFWSVPFHLDVNALCTRIIQGLDCPVPDAKDLILKKTDESDVRLVADEGDDAEEEDDGFDAYIQLLKESINPKEKSDQIEEYDEIDQSSEMKSKPQKLFREDAFLIETQEEKSREEWLRELQEKRRVKEKSVTKTRTVSRIIDDDDE